MSNASLLPLETMQEWIKTHRSQWMEDYATFLRFPSISSEPDYQQDLLNCAQWVCDYLKEIGFEVDYWPTSGHPVLFAQNLNAGPQQPTLLIYNHYDVQPVDPLEEWHSPPFEPTIRDGQIYARGAQDNKGQCFYVLQALKLIKDHFHSFPINIKLCIEGEEEMGSKGLAQILSQKQEELKADYLAVVDCGLRHSQIPAISLGVRGIVTFDIEMQGSQTDLHSGSHGGIAINPIHALIKLLSDLRNDTGKITIPGFYDDVNELSAEERTGLSLNFDAVVYQEETGAYPYGGEKAYTAFERAWTRPTIEINGIQGGYTGKGFKTVIPAKVTAKLSCRLVPFQQPEKIIELVTAYLKKCTPSGMDITVHAHDGQGKAVRVNPDAKVVKCFAQALTEVFGIPCEYILMGGSIPITAELAEYCKGETIFLGLGLNTDKIHAPNEHFGIDRLEKGILMMARAIQLLTKTATHTN